MEEKTIRTLEYEKVLQRIAAFASSAPAKNAILTMRPLESMEAINAELDRVEEADKILFQYAVSPNFNFEDISDALKQASVLSMLTMQDLLKICRVLKTSAKIHSQILTVQDDSLIRLKTLAKTLYVNRKLSDDIDNAILSDMEMSDDASPDLRNIRMQIKRVGENIKIKLNSYISSPTYSQYIQDNIVTVRGDRYVIPLKAEYKGMIPGLIHDRSASGSTLYVEPMAIVEMNNDLKQLFLEEKAEIDKILRAFTARISGETGLLQYTLGVMVDMDIVFAKALFGNAVGGVRPVLNKRGYVNIQKGRHPLIDPKKVIANDISIGDGYKMLVITGPNTGGKTVCLKLIGLLELIGMSGIFIPCIYADIAVFDQIYCDIGDEQSIEQCLSTFSSHMTNVIKIIDNITANSLILLDELGAGTDPTEGAALALGIAQYIMKVGAKAVITTHYNEFKEYAVVTEGVQNASMDFDPVTYSPTYRLIIGTPGASNALLIAGKLGLKKEILEEAQQGIAGHKVEFENVLLSLEKVRRETENNLEKSIQAKEEAERMKSEVEKEKERLFEQREKLNANVRKETRRLVEEAMLEANEIIDQMRSLLDEPTESDIFKAQKLRKSLKKYVIIEDNEFKAFGEEDEGEIVVGDRVLIQALKAEGEVISVNPIKQDAKVRMGKITTNVKLSDLTKLKNVKQKIKERPQSTKVLYNEQVSPEILLIGKTSIEAESELTEYLDKAVRVGLHEVRIIHGYGEGILRQTVQKALKKRPEVDRFRDGEYGEGGKGVTIAYFK